jgi:hypothetical protein
VKSGNLLEHIQTQKIERERSQLLKKQKSQQRVKVRKRVRVKPKAVSPESASGAKYLFDDRSEESEDMQILDRQHKDNRVIHICSGTEKSGISGPPIASLLVDPAYGPGKTTKTAFVPGGGRLAAIQKNQHMKKDRSRTEAVAGRGVTSMQKLRQAAMEKRVGE